MEAQSYADRAVVLANAELTDLRDAKALLRAHTSDWYARRATAEDLHVLQEVTAELRTVFAENDGRRKVGRVNALLRRWPVTPLVSGHDGGGWHLHVTGTSTRSLAARELVTSACYGLALALAEHGPERLGVCTDPACRNAFIARNSGRPRRWCSDRCATRAHVAAYRARQRAHAETSP